MWLSYMKDTSTFVGMVLMLNVSGKNIKKILIETCVCTFLQDILLHPCQTKL